MEEAKNFTAVTSQYKFKKKFLKDVWLSFLSLINSLANFFKIRQSERFWGIVYDSVTKQPLDPVIVKLLYSDGREVETCITGLNGGFGFLARPGKFKIFVRKTNYTFPSKYAAGNKDEIFENLYHGEFFELHGNSEVVAPNIPMDPVSSDWNQEAKGKIKKSYPYGRFFLKKLIVVFFWFGLLFCLVGLWEFYPLRPAYLNWALGVYSTLIVLGLILPEPRLWGQIILGSGITQSPDLYLHLENEKLPGMVFGKASIHENGRFLLRGAPGRYLLLIYTSDKNSQKILLGSVRVKLDRQGLLNSTLVIEKS